MRNEKKSAFICVLICVNLCYQVKKSNIKNKAQKAAMKHSVLTEKGSER